MAEINSPEFEAEVKETAENLPVAEEPIEEKVESKPPKKKSKAPLILGIVAAVLIAVAVGGFFVYKNVIAPMLQYQQADALLEQGDFAGARQMFQALGDYNDSSEKVIECDYEAALNALENGEYDSAKQMFIELSGYKDSEEKVKKCDYEVAMIALENGEYDTAKQMFSELGDYKDSEEKVKHCDYKKAVAFYEERNFKKAVELFSSVYDYGNSSQFVYNVYKHLAGQDYVDKYTKGVEYLSDYLQNQKSSFLAFAYAVRWGSTTETSWSPSLTDSALTNMQNCMAEMTAMKSAYDAVFTQAVINACNDETLRTANQKFNSLHSSASNMLSLSKAMDYVSSMLNGSTTQLTTDTNNAANAMREYTAIYNKMQ